MSDAAVRQRRARQAWAAAGSSHDRLIGMLRIVLPLAIAVMAVLLALAPLLGGRDISFVLSKDRVAVAHERMRAEGAVYRGQDAKGQAFALQAGSAVQLTSRDPVVRLNDLSGRLDMTDGPATVTAPRGRYDMSQETVAIDGPVRFRRADGYQLDTRDVAVDLPTRLVRSGGAVDGRMPLGTFRANQLSADLRARTVVLSGRARLHIVQGAARGTR
jgi:lipopolysaccharide export system protein LptC